MANDFEDIMRRLRPGFTTHLIAPSHALDFAGGNIREIDGDGKIIRDFGSIEALKGDSAQATGQPPSAWIAYARWKNTTTTPISFLKTTWIVPPEPATKSSQIVYLFNGLETADTNEIYQPVLGWVQSGSYTGWVVFSGYAIKYTMFYTSPVKINVGGTLTATLTLTGTSTTTNASGGQVTLYSYNCQFDNVANTTLNIVNSTVPLTNCVETLELVGIPQATFYPADILTKMTAIEARLGTAQAPLDWTVTNNQPSGPHCVVAKNGSPGGEVDIYYINWMITTNGNTGSGTKNAVAWLIGDMEGDGDAEVVHLWNNGGKLGVILYGWVGGTINILPGYRNDTAGTRVDAVKWLIGKISSDTSAQVIQLTSNGSNKTLGIILYGTANGAPVKQIWSSNDMKESSTALSWQVADLYGHGTDEIVQIYSKNSKVAFNIYGWALSNAVSKLSSTPTNESTSALFWTVGRMMAGTAQQIIQIWSSSGKFGVTIYGYSTGTSVMSVLGKSGTLGPNYSKEQWLVGDVTGAGYQQLVQVVNNSGKLFMTLCYWSSSGRAMAVSWSSPLSMGTIADTDVWKIGDINGAGRAEIVRLWKSSTGRLGITAYGWNGSAIVQLWTTSDSGQNFDAINWLVGNVKGGAVSDLVQLWNGAKSTSGDPLLAITLYNIG